MVRSLNGVTEKDLDFIKKSILSFFPKARIMAFGSRLSGENNVYSDLDIAVDDAQKISLSDMRKLKDLFEESDLLFQVDLLDYNECSDSFKKIILKSMVLL